MALLQLVTEAPSCCVHRRSFSPIPPCREVRLENGSIFAVTCLPPDHPHAISRCQSTASIPKSLTHRSLMRMPSRLQSIASSHADKEVDSVLEVEKYDEDALSNRLCDAELEFIDEKAVDVVEDDPPEEDDVTEIAIRVAARRDSFHLDPTALRRALQCTSPLSELETRSGKVYSPSVYSTTLSGTEIDGPGEPLAARFDGPADDGVDRLAVPDEVTESTRQRRPTLAEYERCLTVGGDDRRRPSTAGTPTSDLPRLQKLQDISEDEDDTEQSGSAKRKLSRAHALDEAGKTLMGQALKKHQQEKAMFRSESKRRESLAVAPAPPVFSGSPFAMHSHHVLPSTLQESNETLDPLDIPRLRTSQSVGNIHLEPPSEGSPGSLTTRPSFTTSAFTDAVSYQYTNTISTDASPTAPGKAKTTSRIGTSLPSWSKFPSHTRPERCGSAGPPDDVIVRDFAASPSYVVRTQTARRWSVRRPSRAMKRVFQYYADLFKRGRSFQGGNRRTSVAVASGRVAQPELEMLPPVTGGL